MIKVSRRSRKAVFKMKNMNALTKDAMKEAIYESANGLQKATHMEIIRFPKGGIVYRRRVNGRRVKHVASAAGETHANMTGDLLKSLSYRAVGFKKLEFGYGVKRNDAPKYAKWVEFGTRKMKPRPSLQNGIKSQERNFEINFGREIKAALS